VRRRLLGVVLLTTGTAMLLAGIAMLASDLMAYRLSLAAELVTQADVLALSTGPALAFDDHEVASRDVMALRLRPAVLAVALYDHQGRLYAQYLRTGEDAQPEQLAPTALVLLSRAPQISGEWIEIYRPVRRNGEDLGTIYIRARYSITGRLQEYLGIFAAVLIVTMLLAAFLSDRLHRVITTPLNAMSRVARQIVDKRDYSLRAPTDGDGEIGVVVEAFNRMLDEVEASAAALREADRRKDEFLATLAHELRNPLAPIRHAAYLLDSSNTNERQRQWSKEVIARQVKRMALLLDDLLDVSRITRGRLELKRESVELAQVVNSALETARPLIEAKQLTLEVRLPTQRIRLHADPLRLSQALSNLLTNAAKYTDSGGRIALIAALEQSGLSIAISDTGIGLSAQAIPQLFQMFTQIDTAVDRTEGGLGIGLGLVKGLIELHGGWVEVSSPGPGQGSTFTVRLPSMLLVPETAMVEAPETRSRAASPAMKLCVLIADDNRDAAEALGLLLRRSGHQVWIAHDGKRALQIALETCPHVLLLDIGMPGMTGYEIGARIRAESWGKGALLLALTGWGQREDRQRSRDAGFDDHLTKPASPDALERLIGDYTARIAAFPGRNCEG
jgi:signal transduction histidine kinase/CheY-like chemotaxis protein